eukprot:CAMPEP_0172378952 /NCGR_PEP_ID=MMETSP1060-20121228/69685_1 /TAXON_ID=37318 /ORGANISM="Pseudo-nitzschia pungens, Strain cf. cingulata" /LENGTH=516 /DNA_ID=CAMNT_0013106685 /DNA_START=315 /DNA_END=1865 /DNA_ORIENTATION=+
MDDKVRTVSHRHSSVATASETDTGNKSSFFPLEIEDAQAASNGSDIHVHIVDPDDDDDDDESELVHPLVTTSRGASGALSSSTSSIKSSNDYDHDHGHGHGAGPPGSAGTLQTIVNIIISFVGAGLLGMPNAFSKSGWLLGSCTLVVVSALNVYAMLCLPRVQARLQAKHPTEQVQSYGDLGRVLLGPRGEQVIFVCLGISQAGFATAYVIFIAANLHSIYGWSRGMVCVGCVPGLLGLVQFRELASLAPFSLLANVSNFCALSAVLFQDYEHYTPHNDTIHKADWGGVLYVMGITIYSMEGVGLILSLRSSCKKPRRFSALLTGTLTAITLFMAIFGSAGYWAFGDATEAPITLNLANHWSATFVKCALCLGLYLTYPIMMFPIWNILEKDENESESENDYAAGATSTITGASTSAGTSRRTRLVQRSAVVLVSTLVAYSVPNFGKFLSLVGSSICTLLGFVFPSYFHAKAFKGELPLWQQGLDLVLLVGGFLFGCMGTYQSLVAMMEGELEDHH